MRTDIRPGGEKNRTLVEPDAHAHDLHTGDSIAGHDRALDGRRPTPSRQKRAMKVERAKARRLQHLMCQDLSVGDHHGKVEVERAKGGNGVQRLHRLRRQHVQPQRVRRGVDG